MTIENDPIFYCILFNQLIDGSEESARWVIVLQCMFQAIDNKQDIEHSASNR